MTSMETDSMGTANGQSRPGGQFDAPEAGRHTMTPVLPAQPIYTQLTTDEIDILRHGMMLLDEPLQSAAAASGATGAWSIGAWMEGQLIGVASVSPQEPAGPPMRGFYRIFGVRVRRKSDGVSLIERCIAYAAANGGSTLWCIVPLDAVDVWRRCGFAMASEPMGSANGGAAVRMVLNRSQ